MRRIRLIADDYALAPGVSAAIRDLLAAGRLSGTSVMASSPELREEAARLLALRGPRPFQIGLHVTLTGGLPPCVGGVAVRDPHRFATLPALMVAAFLGRLKRTDVMAEIGAQFSAFMAAFGRAPDFVDGHQHVHLLPMIRDVVLDLTQMHAPAAWVRQCAPAGTQPHAVRQPKAALLARLSRGLAQRCAARGVATNPGFSGAYRFHESSDYATLFAQFIEDLPDGGLVMCHPGHVDALLATRDPLTGPREVEFAYFNGPQFDAALRQANATLA